MLRVFLVAVLSVSALAADPEPCTASCSNLFVNNCVPANSYQVCRGFLDKDPLAEQPVINAGCKSSVSYTHLTLPTICSV